VSQSIPSAAQLPHGGLRLDALRSVVSHELHERHADRDVVLGQLEALRGELRRAGRTQDEEVVLEVMDFLVGWCSPHVCL
jgi:hypothetical protein